jgi:hypothetical protein
MSGEVDLPSKAPSLSPDQLPAPADGLIEDDGVGMENESGAFDLARNLVVPTDCDHFRSGGGGGGGGGKACMEAPWLGRKC